MLECGYITSALKTLEMLASTVFHGENSVLKVLNIEDELKTLIWKLQSEVDREGRSTKTGGSREDSHVIICISHFFACQHKIENRQKFEISRLRVKYSLQVIRRCRPLEADKLSLEPSASWL